MKRQIKMNFDEVEEESNNEHKPLKIYILIKDWIDIGHAVNGVGHAVLILDRKYKDDPIYIDWKDNHFSKVTCKVSEQEFEDAKQYGDYIVCEEMAFDNQEIMLAFKPREEWPKRFKYFKLYK